MKSMIQYKKTERFTLLYVLYRKANGNTDYVGNLREMASHEGMGLRAFKSTYDFLCNENLIKMRPGSESSYEQYYASITEAGVFAIEEVFRDEKLETPYFPSYREMMM